MVERFDVKTCMMSEKKGDSVKINPSQQIAQTMSNKMGHLNKYKGVTSNMTRSLLGYELPNGTIYAQYLQCNGDPLNQGKNYFIGVLKGLVLNAVTQSGKPATAMFQRIKHFLNETQYQSGLSVNNHFTCTRKEWFSLKCEANQEWQYLFTKKGDFIFFHVDGELSEVQIVIPWKLIKIILSEPHKFIDNLKDSLWWNAVTFYDSDENKKVISWGKNAPLHINDKLDYDSSIILKEKLFKGEPVSPTVPVLKIEYGEVDAFPSRPDGFRSYSIMTVGTNLKSSRAGTTFAADTKDERKNQGTVKALYLRGKKRIKE